MILRMTYYINKRTIFNENNKNIEIQEDDFIPTNYQDIYNHKYDHIFHVGYFYRYDDVIVTFPIIFYNNHKKLSFLYLWSFASALIIMILIGLIFSIILSIFLISTIEMHGSSKQSMSEMTFIIMNSLVTTATILIWYRMSGENRLTMATAVTPKFVTIFTILALLVSLLVIINEITV